MMCFCPSCYGKETLLIFVAFIVISIGFLVTSALIRANEDDKEQEDKEQIEYLEKLKERKIPKS